MKEIKIMVAAHKKYRMPDDDIYLPIQVGAQGKPDIGYTRDDTGDNISSKNANFCELTGLYWMWKNTNYEYIGLTHYRRHFSMGKSSDKWERVADRKAIEAMLSQTDIILPPMRRYYIESIFSQHAHAHNAVDLVKTKEIIKEKYPEYLPAFDKCMGRSYGHKFNIFVMKKSYADQYCEWLFDILFELERRLDISAYSAYDARVFGYVSECLLDVWIEKNNYTYKQMPVMFMEKQNWFVKGGIFLLRKIGIKKV